MPASRQHVALLAMLVLVTAGPVAAWWDPGHMLTAKLAWDRLTPEAKSDLSELLAVNLDVEKAAPGTAPAPTKKGVRGSGGMDDEGRFIRSATYMDDIKGKGMSFVDVEYNKDSKTFTTGPAATDGSTGRRFDPWHFITLKSYPKFADWNVEGGDDEDQAIEEKIASLDGQETLLWAMQEMTALISNPHAHEYDRAWALQAIVHLAGDMWQPFHSTSRAYSAKFLENSGMCPQTLQVMKQKGIAEMDDAGGTRTTFRERFDGLRAGWEVYIGEQTMDDRAHTKVHAKVTYDNKRDIPAFAVEPINDFGDRQFLRQWPVFASLNLHNVWDAGFGVLPIMAQRMADKPRPDEAIVNAIKGAAGALYKGQYGGAECDAGLSGVEIARKAVTESHKKATMFSGWMLPSFGYTTQERPAPWMDTGVQCFMVYDASLVDPLLIEHFQNDILDSVAYAGRDLACTLERALAAARTRRAEAPPKPEPQPENPQDDGADDVIPDEPKRNGLPQAEPVPPPVVEAKPVAEDQAVGPASAADKIAETFDDNDATGM